jgi:hypothetical protein
MGMNGVGGYFRCLNRLACVYGLRRGQPAPERCGSTNTPGPASPRHLVRETHEA